MSVDRHEEEWLGTSHVVHTQTAESGFGRKGAAAGFSVMLRRQVRA